MSQPSTASQENHEGPDPSVGDCVNIEQICSWIKHCDATHGIRCTLAEYQPSFPTTSLKLIDVIGKRLVDAPPAPRYFALSYMWGGIDQLQLSTKSESELSQDGTLERFEALMPQTVRDAIEFVIKCNERYLWVDSLCICQDDRARKHGQIEQMGAIYNGAIATLVAALGVDAHFGLAGVWPGTRNPEKRKPQYHDVYLIEPGVKEYTSFRKPRDGSAYIHLGRRIKARELDLVQRLSKTAYIDRAWTYQERLLARRCIYFMDNMVYFSCRTSIYAENKLTPYSEKVADIRPLCLFSTDPIFSGDSMHFKQTLGAVYAGVIKEYTRKNLSYSSDIMNAFSGIASAMEKTCSWRFLHGLPEPIFDYALLWGHTAKPQRRVPTFSEDPIPSWSWAGWHGEADYNHLVVNTAGYEPYLPDSASLVAEWTIIDETGHRAIQSALPSVSDVVRWNIQPSRHKLSPDEVSRIHAKNKASGRTLVTFNALTMQLEHDITKIDKGLKPSPETEEIKPRSFFHDIVGKYTENGYLIVCLSISRQADNMQGMMNAVHDPLEIFDLNVLIVERIKGIAERRAVGRVKARFLANERLQFWGVGSKADTFVHLKYDWKMIVLA